MAAAIVRAATVGERDYRVAAELVAERWLPAEENYISYLIPDIHYLNRIHEHNLKSYLH